MNKLKSTIISWLLHHANRYYESEYFYGLKRELLLRYGKHVGYDVQFIDGKKCHTCDGNGVYRGYSFTGPYNDTCYRCDRGWYRKPEWNILEVISFGKYTFHQPWKRVYEKPEIAVRSTIEGYVQHRTSYWSLFARCVLYALYRRADYKSKWTFELRRNGYRVYWFKMFPYNFLVNSINTITQGKSSYFFRWKIKPLFERFSPKNKYKNIDVFEPDDLPF